MGVIKNKGKKINKLTILDVKRENARTYYYCKCECGTEKWIRADIVLSGKQKSCGCYNIAIHSKNLLGMKFGILTVIEKIGKDKTGQLVWKCKCECGNITHLTSNSLINKGTMSCGCLRQKVDVKLGQEAFKEKYLVEGTNLAVISRNKPISTNKSGVTGVRWDKTRKKWIATIEFQGKARFLGRYNDKENAIKARKKAEEELFSSVLEKYNNNKM